MTRVCKYYRPYMDNLKNLCELLYELPECGCGGMLHIVLDDDNLEDDDIYYCLKECVIHPEKPESALGIVICNELLKMTMEERLVFDWYWTDGDVLCPTSLSCKDCRCLEA